MEIRWFGHSFFQIITKEKISIVIDPFSETIGLKVPKVEADILLITHSHQDHNNKKAIKGNYFLIEEPGEYEIKNVFIQGILSFHDKKEGKERGENIMYKILAEEISLLHLGDFGQEDLEKEQLEKIKQIDILMVPVGGVFTIGPKEAKKIVERIRPKIILPMHYKLPNLKIKLEPVENFLSLLSEKKPEKVEVLKIKRSEISQIKRKVVLFSL